MRSRISPLGALVCGIAAGVVGSYAQNVFFRLTKRLTPDNPPDVFEHPEPEQAKETATQTIARRLVEGLAMRGPVLQKGAAGQVVHYAFGAAWGALYGLVAASIPSVCTLRGGASFGVGVWLVSDNLMLPTFRLAAWPGAYPVKTHAYAIAAHAVYGAAAFATVVALEKLASRRTLATLGALWYERKTWRPLRPTVRRFAKPTIHGALLARDVARALA